MAKRQIKQVKAHLYEAEAKTMNRVRLHYGFKSDYEFVRASVLFCIRMLDEGGLTNFRDLPREVSERLSDIINAYMLDSKIALEAQGDLFADSKAKQLSATPREWVERFISVYYDKLFTEFRDRVQISRGRDGFTQVDIYQDIILDLYFHETDCKSYEEWEEWALEKFKCQLAIAEAEGEGRRGDETNEPNEET